MQNRNSLVTAIRYALGAGAVAGLAMTAAPVVAQDDEAAELDRVQVTGSRISRTDIEGPSPVTILSREDLEMTGQANLADVLRTLNFNSFGSFDERSGTTAQSQALLSLRGLGSARTLVLLDGRRIPNSPVVGASAVDLNILPLEAVERIEVLTDSASAVYGSDALGGVVNIILRKDFTGGQVKVGAERPSQSGRDAEQGSFILGGQYDRGRFLISAEAFRRAPIFDRDRPWSAAFDAGTGNIADTRGISLAGNVIIPLAPLPGTGTAWVPPPQCDPDVYAGILDIPQGQACAYDYASQSMMTASLHRQSMYVTADYELNADHRLYFQQYAARVRSLGRYAPAVGLFFVSADAPTNPFPGTPSFLFHRFAAFGNRDGLQTNTVMDSMIGLEGRIGAIDYDWNIRHNRYETSDFGATYALASIASELVASGAYDPFNPFDPANAPAIAQMSHSIHRDVRGWYWDTSLVISGDAVDLPSGMVRWAAGAEYRNESFKDTFDLQSQAGNVLGTAGGASGGGRDAWAVFTEWLIPLHDMVELTLAGRYDEYEIGGERFSPQVALRFTPMDNLLLRASWGRGFRAPDVDTLFQAPSQSFEFARDFVQCDAQGIPDAGCAELQFETFFLNNPDLDPEKSESINLGIVWEPVDRLVVTADVYNIEVTDVISFPSLQGLINLQREGLALPGGTRIVRRAAGDIDFAETSPANIARIEREGLDMTVEYSFPTDIGQFGVQAAWSRMWKAESQSTPLDPSVNAISRNTFPGNRTSWRFNWAQGDFRVSYSGYWIASTAAATQGSGDNLVLTGKVPSYVQHDINLTYFAPWNGELQVGVRNLSDRDPSLNSFTGDLSRAAQSLYPVIGRVPFVNYTQRF